MQKQSLFVSDIPLLAKEWHPTKNGDLTPETVRSRSGRSVWWKCAQGHEWEARVANRTVGNGCPYCGGRKALPGYNTLATVAPDTAAEWHPTKNGDLTPSDVAAGSTKKVWWLCKSGHEWQTSIGHRALRGLGCPYCSNHALLRGFNDLSSRFPEIAAEWHPTKNGVLAPSDVVFGAAKRVWWQCSKGHEWEAPLSRRVRTGGAGCPVCAGKKVFVGHNDLATVFPEIAAEWHPTKNGDRKPTEFAKSSGESVWWQCSQGHEWQTKIHTRTAIGSGCPFCAVLDKHSNKDDLVDVNPKYAREWHPTKNGAFTTKDAMRHPETPVWWICENGHEYETPTGYRLLNQGCPICATIYVTPGVNDVATLKPELVKLWHPTKNGALSPSLTSTGSFKQVWWQCPEGHEWQERVVNAIGCPYCSGHRVWPGFNDLASQDPALAAQWHPTKNGDLRPTDVSCGSAKEVWWLYPYDDPKTGKHFDFEWQAPVYSRHRSPACPFLTGARKWPGFNEKKE